MAEFAIRKCGNGWMYCTGECKACIDSQILVTDHTDVMPKACGYWHDVYILDQKAQYCGAKMGMKS